jgi:hypothetical protein
MPSKKANYCSLLLILPKIKLLILLDQELHVKAIWLKITMEVLAGVYRVLRRPL